VEAAQTQMQVEVEDPAVALHQQVVQTAEGQQ
jgi:hypothetical protein